MQKFLKYLAQTHNLFALIAILFGIVFVSITPPLWGIDEPVHFARAYQVSTGNFIFQKEHSSKQGAYGGYIPKTVLDLSRYVKHDLKDNKIVDFYKRKDVDSSKAYNTYKAKPINGKKQFVQVSNIAQYSPVAYAPSAPAIAFARMINLDLGNTILLARLATLVFFVGVIFFCLRLLKDDKTKWLVFTIALLPTTLYQASIVNTDAIVNALAILLFSIVVYWLRGGKLNKQMQVLLLSDALLLPLAKPNYILLSLILPVLYLFRSKAHIYMKLWKSLVLSVLIALPLLIWMLLARHAVAVAPVASVSASLQAHYVLDHPLRFVKNLLISGSVNETGYLFGMIGILGFNQIPAPTTAEVYGFVLLFFAALVSLDLRKPFQKKYSTVFVLSSALCALSIFLTLYLTYNPVGAPMIGGVQGRYFVPLVPFLLFGIVQLLPLRIVLSNKATVIFFGASSLFLLASSLLYFVMATY